jgi:hypothetical protein
MSTSFTKSAVRLEKVELIPLTSFLKGANYLLWKHQENNFRRIGGLQFYQTETKVVMWAIDTFPINYHSWLIQMLTCGKSFLFAKTISCSR